MVIDQGSSQGPRGPARLSVVVVGRDGIASLRPILNCLASQTVARDLEVVAVLPDGSDDPTALSPWDAAFARVTSVTVPGITNRGRAAAAGVRKATSQILAFTENHCFPDPDWAECLLSSHDGRYAGVAPVVLNANPETLLSWVIYSSGYAEYSDRGTSVEIPEMPMHNTSYRRDLLTALDNDLEHLLGHEGRLQARLRDNGKRFLLTPAAKTRHINEATWTLVVGLNFFNGWRYGGRRALGWSWPRRALYATAFPLLSIPVMRRALRRLETCRDKPAKSVRLVATIWLQSLAHAVGEAVGYLGPRRDEFAFVDREEFMILERLGGHPLTDQRLAAFVADAVPLKVVT